MPPLVYPMRWSGGYLPSLDPTRTSPGCPNLRNIHLEPGSRTARLSERPQTLNYATSQRLATIATPGTLSILRFDPAFLGTANGTGIAVVDSLDPASAVDRRVLGMKVHQSEKGLPWPTAGNDVIEDTVLVRRGHRQKPAMASLDGNLYVSDAANPVYCFDGSVVRLAGIRAPKQRASLYSQASSALLVHACDNIWDGATAGGASAVLDSADARVGNSSMRADTMDLETALVTSAVIAITGFDATYTRLRFFIKVNQTVQSGALTIRVSHDGTGSQEDVSIDQIIQKDVWYFTKFPITFPGDATTITALSLRRNSSTGNYDDLSVWLDQIGIDVPIAGSASGTYRAKFSWFDPDRFGGRESNLSPQSSPIILSGQAIEIDFYAQATEDTTNVTRLRIYLQKDLLGPDFHMVREIDYKTTPESMDITDAMIESGQIGENFYGVPPTFKYAQVYGSRFFTAGQDDYSTGTVTTVNGSDTVTGSGTDWQRSMEGMSFQARTNENPHAPDAQIYAIIEVVSTTSMRIALKVGPFGEIGPEDTYQGTGAGSLTYKISGQKSVIRYSTRTARNSLYSEGFHDANQLGVNLQSGDEIMNLGLVNGVLFVPTRKKLFYVLQNHAEFDDSIGAHPVSDPELISDAVGMLASYSLASLPDGSVVFLGTGNDIFRATVQGALPLPGSNSIRDFFTDFSYIDAEIALAKGGYDQRLNQYVLIVTGGSPSQPRALRFDFDDKVWLLDDLPTTYDPTWMGTHVTDDGVPYLLLAHGGLTTTVANNGGLVDRWAAPGIYTVGGIGAGVQVFTVTGGSSTTVTWSAGSPDFPNDYLIGRTVYKISSDGSYETQTITDSGSGTLTVASWTNDPVTTDFIIIDTTEGFLEFEEQSYDTPVSIMHLLLDPRYTANDLFKLDLYAGSGLGRNAVLSSAALTLNARQTQIEYPTVPVSSTIATRALRARLTWLWRGPNSANGLALRRAALIAEGNNPTSISLSRIEGP